MGNINNEIAQKLIGVPFGSLAEIDETLIRLDGAPNKSRLGANAIIAVSMSMAKAIAVSSKMPLYRYIAAIAQNNQPLFIPAPLFNMINGGKHGAGNLDFQEFHVIPNMRHSYAAALETGATIYQTIKKFLSAAEPFIASATKGICPQPFHQFRRLGSPDRSHHRAEPQSRLRRRTGSGYRRQLHLQRRPLCHQRQELTSGNHGIH